MEEVEKLKARLRGQLQALEAQGEYQVRAFKVWDSRPVNELGEAVVRVERNAWKWGACRSETCQHFSHDPYCEGDVIYVTCRPIGEDEKGNEMFLTPSQVLFAYRYARDSGYHYRPTARIWPVKVE